MNRSTRLRAAHRRDGDVGVARIVLEAYRLAAGSAERAAASLDVSRVQLQRWVRRLGIGEQVAALRG